MTGHFTYSKRFMREVARADAARQSNGAAVVAAMSQARKVEVPTRRLLRVYSIDPTCGAAEGGVAILSVPYEQLHTQDDGNVRALVGSRFAILSPRKDANERLYDRFGEIWPDDTRPLVERGYPPSLADPRFIVQMVYAVAMTLDSVFQDALGRLPVLDLGRLDTKSDFDGRLILKPWLPKEGPQAWFDVDLAEINFGSYKAMGHARGYPPDSLFYTALSQDVIVHELSHALLDSVRPYLTVPVNGDVLAFHEAFGDLMVVFQRLGFTELVRSQLAVARGKVSATELLNTLATGFSQTSDRRITLRDISGERLFDGADEDPHERGEVLVQAVYRAFRTVLDRRIQRLIDMATAGSGVLPAGALPPVLLDEMGRLTAKTAHMFQSMMIRALDYCPPLGLTFFGFLRAVVTADLRLIPDDKEGVREAWMEAFRYHHIFPGDSLHYSDEALAGGVLQDFSVPRRIAALSFAETRFAAHPGSPLTLDQAVRQASTFQKEILSSDEWKSFFWTGPSPIFGVATDPDEARPVEIVSIRSFARPGPNRMTEFGAVVELVQTRADKRDASGYMGAGAATLVFDSDGMLVSCASRPADDERVVNLARKYADSRAGQMFWTRDAKGAREVVPSYIKRLCGG